MLKDLIIIGSGGFVGAAGRYLVSKLTMSFWHGAFPLGTFVVNIVGCFIIGLLFGLLAHTNILNHNHNLLLVTGFCGGFTTFSTFANEMWVLGHKDDWWTFAIYLTLSVVVGILCVWAGRALIR